MATDVVRHLPCPEYLALYFERSENDDILLLGLTLTGNWLAEQSEAVVEEMEAVRELVNELD